MKTKKDWFDESVKRIDKILDGMGIDVSEHVHPKSQEETYHIESVVIAPRRLGFVSHIKNLAWGLGIKCEIESEKGWFREHIRFRLTGTKYQMERFRELYQDISNRYNRGK